MKQGADLCSPVLDQMIVSGLFKEGKLEQHIEKIKQNYSRKMKLMLDSLDKYMPKHPEVDWTRPEGGLFLWLSMPSQIDTYKMFKKAVEEEKVAFIPGFAFYHDGSVKNKMRLNFSYSTAEQIAEGIKRLGRIAEKEIAGIE